MKWTLASVALLMAVAGGCANKQNEPTAEGSLDVLTPVEAPPVAYAPPPQPEPVVYDTPVTVTPTPAATGMSYTVRRGDTLWSIAKTQYGDGKQWQRIASANPGVAPQSLRIGQTLMIP